MVAKWPAFAEDFKDIEHYWARFISPEMHGKMRITQGVAYTWAFLNNVVWTLPTAEDWVAQGKHFWIMDLVWDKGISARQAIEIISNDLIEHGDVEDGRPVMFWRGANRRFGTGIVRWRDRDEQRTQDHHHNQRPVDRHAGFSP